MKARAQQMPDLDWVNERFSCSLAKVFETLRLQVQEDVNKWNKLHPEGGARKCSVAPGSNVFTVLSEPPPLSFGGSRDIKKVNFFLCDKSIQVSDKNENKILEATLTLNDLGECKVRINNQEQELWQMRRTALEDLFFNT